MHADEALVVDDMVLVRQLLSRQLARKGWKCHTAADHSQALQILRDHQEIRCAFIDFNVEGTGDTPRFIHHLRSVSPKLKIIGISGYPCEQEFASSGVKQFLMKPWSMSDLDKVLQDQPE